MDRNHLNVLMIIELLRCKIQWINQDTLSINQQILNQLDVLGRFELLINESLSHSLDFLIAVYILLNNSIVILL